MNFKIYYNKYVIPSQLCHSIFTFIYAGENLWLTLFLMSEKDGFIKHSERKWSFQIFKILICHIPLWVKYYIIVSGFGSGFSE